MLQSSGFCSYLKQKIPKRKGIQRSRKLFKLLLQGNQCLIMDDGTNVKKDFAQVLGQQFCYKFKGKDVENKFKYNQTEKFAPKYLSAKHFAVIVSVALHSSHSFDSGYLHQEYLKKRLVKRCFYQDSKLFYTFLHNS